MSTPKRVVHMTTVHHPYDPRIYHKECLSLHRAGFDVTLIAQRAKEELSHDKPINHIPLKSYASRWKRMIFGTLDAYKKAKQLQADLYHFHDPELLPIAWLLKRKSNTVVYDIHEDYITSIKQKDYLPKFVKNIVAKLYKIIERFLSRKFELCLAEKYYKTIYERGTCVLNYPTINKEMMEQDRRKGPLEDKLLYTGNVSVVRGAHIHAEIPHIDPNVTVHFVGKCPKHLANEMKEVAKDNKDRLKFEGIDQFVPKEIIEERYMQHHWLAGIALFPPTEHYMKKELTKFFEYMNAGIPVICSNFPVWKNFVETYNCGIAVDPYNDEEIRQAIQYLREHPEEANKMGENGKQAVSEKLNWNEEEKKLISMYEQILS